MPIDPRYPVKKDVRSIRRPPPGAARQSLTKVYGFEFPPDLFELGRIAKGHLAALDALGVRLVGPFKVLSGGKPAADLDRWPADPPEFFTVAEGNTDGLHWGYVFHDPGREPGYVASFFARDGYPIAGDDPDLPTAIRKHAEASARDLEEELGEIRSLGEDDPKLTRELAKIDAFLAALPKPRPRRRAREERPPRPPMGSGSWRRARRSRRCPARSRGSPRPPTRSAARRSSPTAAR